MNHHEAKFLLRARRFNGKDANDPVFVDALAEAENDPKLKAWLENEAAFDRAMSAKLLEIQPPPGLRDAILAGSRVSQRAKVWWRKPAWLALAASIAIILTIALQFRSPGPSARDFAEYAMHDLATAHESYNGHRPDLTEFQALVSDTSRPLPGNVKIDADALRRLGCRTMTFAGHEVFEICFQRGGRWYHLYATRAEDFSHDAIDPKSLLVSNGHFTATAWKDASFIYAVATYDGADALRQSI
jgi:hypothetical protein